MNELKPCPFCGSDNIFAHSIPNYTRNWNWTVRCNNCDYQGPIAASKEEAIEKWNDRKGTNINDEGK